MLDFFARVPDLMLVVLGFGFIIFIHELGHFAAAKWAGIRVLAFAIGFGPAAVSWRKGLGLRRGSSEGEYQARLRADAASAPVVEGARATHHGISPTEYRLNWLPFGGYVKMLGQDDLDPTAVSAASDSYQRAPVWKRMVVISAGVVMNILLAAVLFIAVFMKGLQTEPAKIGMVSPGSPASKAVALTPGVSPGLKPGDTILSINDRKARSFGDLTMASAMSRRGEAMRMVIARDGFAAPLDFEVTADTGKVSRLMEIGVSPAIGAALLDAGSDEARTQFLRVMRESGLEGVEPGMTLVRVGEKRDVKSVLDLTAAVAAAGGSPVTAEFEGKDGKRVEVTVRPRAALETGTVELDGGLEMPVKHLLGLTPVLSALPAASVGAEPHKQGIMDGDIFARLGAVEFPSEAQGVAEIRRHKGKPIAVEVIRGSERIKLDAEVNAQGQIGFLRGSTMDTSMLVSLPRDRFKESSEAMAASRLITRPGTRIVSVNDRAVGNFTELRAVLREETKGAFEAGRGATVMVAMEPPAAMGGSMVERVEWELAGSDLKTLHGLGWESPVDAGWFKLEQVALRASGDTLVARAGDAITMGIAETHRVMMMTYATFARLFEGTVKVEHLKGPVGIAHIGTDVVSTRGLTWLLFFMALISVNLAVVNFLPLPIVDGGQFLFLIFEGVRGRPVPVQVQNVATIAGLALIGTMFLVVTFHDVVNLFG